MTRRAATVACALAVWLSLFLPWAKGPFVEGAYVNQSQGAGASVVVVAHEHRNAWSSRWPLAAVLTLAAVAGLVALARPRFARLAGLLAALAVVACLVDFAVSDPSLGWGAPVSVALAVVLSALAWSVSMPQPARRREARRTPREGAGPS